MLFSLGMWFFPVRHISMKNFCFFMCIEVSRVRRPGVARWGGIQGWDVSGKVVAHFFGSSRYWILCSFYEIEMIRLLAFEGDVLSFYSSSLFCVIFSVEKIFSSDFARVLCSEARLSVDGTVHVVFGFWGSIKAGSFCTLILKKIFGAFLSSEEVTSSFFLLVFCLCNSVRFMCQVVLLCGDTVYAGTARNGCE